MELRSILANSEVLHFHQKWKGLRDQSHFRGPSPLSWSSQQDFYWMKPQL